MKTADEIMGLATQAVKEQMTANQYLLGSSGKNGNHIISDARKSKGKNVAFVANSHQEMMDKIEEIKAERLVRAVARILLPEMTPQFDAMVPAQESLVIKLCQEIAGAKGERGSPPDPVRLLEIASEIYKAEMRDATRALSEGMSQ